MANYVLIHGSYQGGWIWQPTAERLRQNEHTVYAPTMDGCAERQGGLRVGITATTMAKEVVDLFFYEGLEDIILVGTSSGGIVISKAAELAREKIKHLVYIDALAPQPGETIADIVIRGPNPEPYEENEFAYGPSRKGMEVRLFADLEPTLKKWALDRATLHPKGASAANLDKFWAQNWPATVIFCTGSLNPSEAHQRRTKEKLNASWHTIDAGHYPMLSHGDETARILMEEIG